MVEPSHLDQLLHPHFSDETGYKDDVLGEGEEDALKEEGYCVWRGHHQRVPKTAGRQPLNGFSHFSTSRSPFVRPPPLPGSIPSHHPLVRPPPASPLTFFHPFITLRPSCLPGGGRGPGRVFRPKS